jgi:lipoyl(octanoyl) transferase
MITVLQLGAIDYATGLSLQQRLVEMRKDGRIGDVFLLLEHTPVITLGRNADRSNLLASPELLAARGVEIFECDRGGDITFHGPGQLVGYPIFDLRAFPAELSSRASEDDFLADSSITSKDPGFTKKHLGVVDYVRRLEEVLIRACADFAIPTRRIPGLTGVWTEPKPTDLRPTDLKSTVPQTLSSRAEVDDSLAKRSLQSRDLVLGSLPEAKIAAIGVHISRGVTSHGFALNVTTDLSYFDFIIPCGIASKPVTSMSRELSRPPDPQAVAHSISRNFGNVFQSQILWVETLDALLGHSVGVPMKTPKELRQIHRHDDTTWA